MRTQTAKFIRKASFLLLGCTCIIFNAATCHGNKKITILVEDDCPYSCQSENGPNGFIQDILLAIFTEENYTLEFRIYPWLRIMNDFNAQRASVDGMIGMKNHPINKSLALFPEEEIAQYNHKFYARVDSPLIKSWQYEGVESLKNLKIGSMKGWTYSDKKITEYLKQGSAPFVQPLHGEGGTERNFRKLLTGRIDLWISNATNTDYFLAKEREAGNKSVDEVIGFLKVPVTSDVNVYPIFYNNEEGRIYAAVFTDGIRRLRANGKLQTIMQIYGLSDWK